MINNNNMINNMNNQMINNNNNNNMINNMNNNMNNQTINNDMNNNMNYPMINNWNNQMNNYNINNNMSNPIIINRNNPAIYNDMNNPMINNNPIINNNINNNMNNDINNNMINLMTNYKMNNPNINNNNYLLQNNNFSDFITNNNTNNYFINNINMNDYMINSNNNPLFNNNIYYNNINCLPNNPLMNNEFPNPLINNNTQLNINNGNINPEVINKMNQIFQRLNPGILNSLTDENIKYKKKWEEVFIRYYKLINEYQEEEESFNKNEVQIIFNYYNLCKKKIYIDLNLKIDEIIWIILNKIGYNDINYIRREYKRINPSQTTKYIIENPIIYFEKDNLNEFDYDFIIEYNGKNLFDLLDKTGYEIGIKENRDINFKLNNKYILNMSKDIWIYISFDIIYGKKGKKYILKSHKKELLSSVIERFLKKCDLDYSSDVLNNIKFFYNTKELNEFDKTMELIFVNYNNISIHVFYRTDIIGAGPLIFVDVSRGKIREISSDQIVGNLSIGLNIIGICTNNNCDAKGKKVAYSPKFEEKLIFNLNENKFNCKCPICSLIIIIKSLCFSNCEYQFIGIKLEQGKQISFESNPKETKKNVDYYDYLDGVAKWIDLNIYVLPKQKIKYNKTN